MENAKLLHRQKVRFTIDVEVTVADRPQALLDDFRIPASYASWTAEDYKDWLQYQKRILHAVINAPNVLSELVLNDAGLEAAEHFSREYMSSNSSHQADENLFAPVIATLNSEDKQQIEEAIGNGAFSENTEIALFESFESKVVGTDVEILE